MWIDSVYLQQEQQANEVSFAGFEWVNESTSSGGEEERY
jgi:hypothetical protein